MTGADKLLQSSVGGGDERELPVVQSHFRLLSSCSENESVFSSSSQTSEDSDNGIFKAEERGHITGLNQAATATSPNSFTNVQKSLNFDGDTKRED